MFAPARFLRYGQDDVAIRVYSLICGVRVRNARVPFREIATSLLLLAMTRRYGCMAVSYREPSPAIILFVTTALLTYSFLFRKILELRWRGESLDQPAKEKTPCRVPFLLELIPGEAVRFAPLGGFVTANLRLRQLFSLRPFYLLALYFSTRYSNLDGEANPLTNSQK